MKKFVILVVLLIGLSGLSVYHFFKFYDGRLHVVFCDVGQGDAIFIRTPKGLDILVDSGPNDSVLTCLSNHMPFWDRDLELVVLTHPHEDHFKGLLKVFTNYKVSSFATENLQNKTEGFTALVEMLKAQKIPTRFVLAGDRFRFKDGVSLKIVGPTKEFLKKTSPEGFIGESNEFGSVEMLVRYKNFSTLLTGDSQASELEDALSRLKDINSLSVLQVPHHGSKTGLNPSIVQYLRPKLAVISVGKNSYGHPSAEILKILRDKDIKILRTDEDGEIEIVSNGSSLLIR